MSIISLKSQLQTLEDTHKKGAVKQKKMKRSLEDVINDPGLPSHLRTKLVMLLTTFNTASYSYSARDEDTQLTAHMTLDILSDHEQPSPTAHHDKSISMDIGESRSTGTNKPSHRRGDSSILQESESTTPTSSFLEKKQKIINYKRRDIKHKRKNPSLGNIPLTNTNSYSMSQSDYDRLHAMAHDDDDGGEETVDPLPKITVTKPRKSPRSISHNRSVSHSVQSSSSLSKTSNSGILRFDPHDHEDSESEHEAEEKSSISTKSPEMIMTVPAMATTQSADSFRLTQRSHHTASKSMQYNKPLPLPRRVSPSGSPSRPSISKRPKPPPPPRRQHKRAAASDSLNRLASNRNPSRALTTANLSQINEDSQRMRSATHIGSPQSPSRSSLAANIGSPSRTMSFILDLESNHHISDVDSDHPPEVTSPQNLNGRNVTAKTVALRTPNAKLPAPPPNRRHLHGRANTAYNIGMQPTRPLAVKLGMGSNQKRENIVSPPSGDASDSEFSVDSENIFDPNINDSETKRNRFFHMNLNWKKDKKRKQSIKVSKKEEKNLNERRTSLRHKKRRLFNDTDRSPTPNRNRKKNKDKKRSSAFISPVAALSSKHASYDDGDEELIHIKSNPSSPERKKGKKHRKKSSKHINPPPSAPKLNPKATSSPPLTMSQTESVAFSPNDSESPGHSFSGVLSINPLAPLASTLLPPDDEDEQQGKGNILNNIVSHSQPMKAPNAQKMNGHTVKRNSQKFASKPLPNSLSSNTSHHTNLTAPLSPFTTMSRSQPTSPITNNNMMKSNRPLPEAVDDVQVIGRNLLGGGLLEESNYRVLKEDDGNRDKKRKRRRSSKKKKGKSNSVIIPQSSKDYYRNKHADKDRDKNDKGESSNNTKEKAKRKMSRPEKALALISKMSGDRDKKDTPEKSEKSTKPKERRSSFSIKRRKKTDHFELKTSENRSASQHGKRRGSHRRSLSLRGNNMSFSLSPRPRGRSRKESLNIIGSPRGSGADTTPERRRKSIFGHHKGAKSMDVSSISRSVSNSSSDEEFDANKVWTLKDLIREMVSNQYNTDRVRDALILCHVSFTSSTELFDELRRFFRMSIAEMKNNILFFDDDEDEQYASPDDRRWFMRQKITDCIVYWLQEYWVEDFAKSRDMQRNIELFKADIRSVIRDATRSKLLIDPLMATLTIIAEKYGGINPKNLNLSPQPMLRKANPTKPLPPLLGPENTDASGESKEDGHNDRELESSIIIHEEDEPEDDEDDDDDDEAKDDGDSEIHRSSMASMQRRQFLHDALNLNVSQRGRTEAIKTIPHILPAVSTSNVAQDLIKAHTEEQEKKELERLSKEVRTVGARYPNLIRLDIPIPAHMNIMGLDPEDVAIQLTLMDSFVFKKIKQRECIEQSWKKKDKAVRAPNILKMISQFNDVSKWVQATILSGTTPRLRKRYIKKMISMATYFMQHGNLSSLCAFYNALTSNNILSLHASWKLLSKRKRKEMEEIKNLFGWKMQKFKEIQEELQPPCIPHIGIILQVLFQIDEGKQNKGANGSVNYIKMMMLHEQIDHLQYLQTPHYREEPDFVIQKILIKEFGEQSDLTERDLYKMTKALADVEKK